MTPRASGQLYLRSDRVASVARGVSAGMAPAVSVAVADAPAGLRGTILGHQAVHRYGPRTGSAAQEI